MQAAAQARKRENSSRVEQMVVKKKMKVCQKKKAETVVKLDSPVVENGGSEEIQEVIIRPKEHANGGGDGIEAMDMDLVKVAEEAITEKSAYGRVIDTIRTFNTQYLHFVQVTFTCAHKFQVYCILIYLIFFTLLPYVLYRKRKRGVVEKMKSRKAKKLRRLASRCL